MSAKAPYCAMVMAAGKGTRMMPLTADRPKPLIEVAGTSLLDHVLGHLRDFGVSRIVINVHYRAQQVEEHMLQWANDFEYAISDERDVLRDTGGGLVKAKDLLSSDPFFCINADNWWTNGKVNALERLANAWDADIMDVLMLVIPTGRANNTQGNGDFDMDPSGRLSREGEARSRPYVWTGIQLMAKHVITDPPEDVFSTNVFWNRAIDAGRCHAVVHDGEWFDVGYPAAVIATEKALAVHDAA
jgi:N-acetyl-alpha-D-muramate 1-phosphate uridylyltransferase